MVLVGSLVRDMTSTLCTHTHLSSSTNTEQEHAYKRGIASNAHDLTPSLRILPAGSTTQSFLGWDDTSWSLTPPASTSRERTS